MMLASVDLPGATLPLSKTHPFAMLVNALAPTSSEASDDGSTSFSVVRLMLA